MKRNFIYLAILTLVAVAVAVFLAPADHAPDRSAADSLLMPAIADQVNDVDRVEIITAGNTIVASLVRSASAWQVEQMGGYRADWSKLQALLAALAQARVIEPKTDNPQYYERLGVEDVSAEDAASVLVRISIGDQVAGVLIGNPAQGRPGQYVRLENTAGSALVNQEFEVPREALDWTDSSIIDINSSEVAEVEIIHPDSERLRVMRISADQTDFDLVGLPPGRELNSSWAVNSLGSVLSMLNLVSVQSADRIDWAGAVKLRLLLFSGVEILADLVQQDEEYLLRLQASHPGSGALPAENGDSGTDTETEERAAADVAKQVDDINQKVSGWAYGISKAKFDAIVKKPEDLLKPLATP